MKWRPALDELTRRYLAQQIEIGGAELVVQGGPGAPGGRSGPAQEPLPRSAPPPSRPARPPDHPVRPDRPVRSDRPAKDWRADAPPVPGPGLSIESPPMDLLSNRGPSWSSLTVLADHIAKCEKCLLCEGRTNTVPGEGHARAKMMCVGEGPGQTEDATGRPFVGRAGELLNEILAAIGYRRDEVFIANVVKCRPPQNRKPLPDEISACLPYLEAQIELIRPQVLVALGATAAEALLNTKRSLADLRLKVHSYRGIPLVVTYHPAALLRNPNWKKPAWDDIRIARQLVDR